MLGAKAGFMFQRNQMFLTTVKKETNKTSQTKQRQTRKWFLSWSKRHECVLLSV